jgi:hypothetical protein
MITQDHPLAGVWAKIERAEKHISDFRKGGQTFLQNNPYTLAHKPDPNTGRDILFYKDIKTTPIELSLLIGDAIHNLRSALDLLACQLVRLNVVNHNCADISFPIADNAKKFKTLLNSAKVQLLGQGAVQILQQLEPYQGGKRHELWQLHRLNVQDKHRLLIVALAGIGSMVIDITPPGINTPAMKIPTSSELTIPKKGDLIFAIDSSIYAISANGQVDVKGKFTTDIAFNEPQIIKCQSVFNTLITFVEIVKDAIKQFDLFFPQKRSN